MNHLVYGPVPSRRLGKSLGVNHIPPKICSYACVYCQLGKAIRMERFPGNHYDWKKIVAAIKEHVKLVESRNEHIDYIAFVPDGEPTLDINLKHILNGISDLPYKKAIITNGSLLNMSEVREALYNFDWVSIKVDAFSENIWHPIDHPYRNLNLKDIQKGLVDFAASYNGKLVTETMLVDGINTDINELNRIAIFLKKVKPAIAYIAIPTRTPARKDIKPANEHQINDAFQIFTTYLDNVEYLIGHEGHDFAHTGNVEKDILSITAVHPMREDSIKHFLDNSNTPWSVIESLIEKNLLIETKYNGYKFYVRKLKKKNQF